jgi:CRP-like cAMP-binding protein
MFNAVTRLDEGQRERLIDTYGRKFKAGEVIFRQDDRASSVYVLQEGRVRLVKRIRLVERNLMVLGPGDLFGESALLPPGTYPCTAVALTESFVLGFESETFGSLVRSHPELALRLMRQLVRRVREAEDQVENMLLRDKQSRIVNVLLKMGRQQAEEGNDRVSLRMTPVELSSRVGLDVDTIKRGVHELRKGEYLRVTEEKLEIPSLAALEKLFELIGMKEDLRGDT